MPSDVQVDAMGDHARYLLPRRQLGAVRWLGLVPLAFGCFVLFILAKFVTPVHDLWSSKRAEQITALCVAVFLVVFLVPILRIMLFGLVFIAGRSEVRLINGKLSAREWVGPLFWTRRLKLKTPVQRVSVGFGDGTVTVNGQPSEKLAHLGRLAGLGVEAGPEKKDRFLLTIGYPKDMLLAVGQDLASRMHVDFREGLMDAGEWLDDEAESKS